MSGPLEFEDFGVFTPKAAIEVLIADVNGCALISGLYVEFFHLSQSSPQTVSVWDRFASRQRFIDSEPVGSPARLLVRLKSFQLTGGTVPSPDRVMDAAKSALLGIPLRTMLLGTLLRAIAGPTNRKGP